MGTVIKIEKSILILFDGECNLCNGYVQFVIKRDPGSIFHFASLQSSFAKDIVTRYHENPEVLSTIMVVKNDRLFQRSNAVLEIVRNLGGLWPVLYIFKIVPSVIRDGIYNWVARNRYRWFGKRDECMIPTPELKSRFVDSL